MLDLRVGVGRGGKAGCVCVSLMMVAAVCKHTCVCKRVCAAHLPYGHLLGLLLLLLTLVLLAHGWLLREAAWLCVVL